MPVQINQMFLKHESPLAGVINRASVRENRSLGYSEVRLHVSDIMKTDAQFGFCERQHVIQKLFRPKILSASLPASFDLLFDLGNALHDNARNRWMRNDRHGPLRVLARWHCPCKTTWHNGVNPHGQPECSRCGFRPTVFEEHEIHDKEFCIIAHPDFSIVKGDDVIKAGVFDKSKHKLRIVEIKGIDRAEVNWNTLDAPLGEHRLQGTFYYHLYKRAGYKVDKVISFLYGERSLKETLFRGDPWKEFECEASEYERVAPFFAKAKTVIDSVAEKRVPERTVCSKVDCARAKNCPVANLCFEINRHGYQVKKTRKIVLKGSKREIKPLRV
jgi:hypothetical protein